MKLTRYLAAAIIAAVCIAPATGHAEPFGHFGHGGPMPMPLMMVLRHANLTADQKAKVHQIMESNMTQARPLMKELHGIDEQISDKLLSTTPVSNADLEPLQKRESQIHQQLDQQMLASALQIRNLLTPDQLSRVADLHKKLKALRDQIHALMGEDEQPPPGPPSGF